MSETERLDLNSDFEGVLVITPFLHWSSHLKNSSFLSLKSSSRGSSPDLRDCSSGVKSNCMFFNASTPNLGWLMFVVLKPIWFIFTSLPTFPRSLFLKYYTRFGFTLSFPLLVTHGSSSISSIQSLFVGSLQRIYRIKSLAC